MIDMKTILCLLPLLIGCGASMQMAAPALKPITEQITDDRFKRDASGSISEEDLHKLLATIPFLEEKTRLGVLPVASGYMPDGELPLPAIPGELVKALEDSGLFDLATEVSTDFPADRGVSGLRELAARYRVQYLLLYRERFVDRSWTNAWGWTYATVLGALVAPSQTLETAGVVEATLFDVQTGTLLFTVYERVHDQRSENLWHNEHKLRTIKSELLTGAARRLADEVVTKSRRLAAARPRPPLASN
jgi:hypothetical protein